MKIIANIRSRLTVVLAVLLAAGLSLGSAYARAPGLVEVTSQNSFGATVVKLESAVSQNGLVVLKKFNLQTMLNMVGVHAQKGMTFEIFHPKYGKNVYRNNSIGFLAVPLRVLILQRGGAVKIYYQKPSTLLDPFGLSNLGNRLDPLFQRIVAEAAR